MKDPKFLRVPYAQSVHGQAEIDAVVAVLKSSLGCLIKNTDL